MAAYQGRLETLFVSEGMQVWGSFDPVVNAVQVHEVPKPGDEVCSILWQFTPWQAVERCILPGRKDAC